MIRKYVVTTDLNVDDELSKGFVTGNRHNGNVVLTNDILSSRKYLSVEIANRIARDLFRSISPGARSRIKISVELYIKQKNTYSTLHLYSIEEEKTISLPEEAVNKIMEEK